MNNTAMINKLGDSLEDSLMQHNDFANIGKSERMISLGAGAFIGMKGLTNIFSHPLLALTELGIGGALLYRGVTGYCHLTAMAQEETRSQTMPATNTMEMGNTAPTSVTERIDPDVAY